MLTTHPKFRVTQGRTEHNKSRTPWTYFIIFIFSLWGHFRDMFNMSKRVKKLKWWYLCQLYLDVVLFQQVINNITQEHSDRCVIILPHVNLISELSAMDTIWYSNTLRLHRTWVAHCASFGADGLLLADIPGSGYLNNFVIYIFFYTRSYVS